MLGGVFDLCGSCKLPERHPGAGRIEYADGLVRQLAARNVARRQTHRLGDGFVPDADVEMFFHEWRHTAQHSTG